MVCLRGARWRAMALPKRQPRPIGLLCYYQTSDGLERFLILCRYSSGSIYSVRAASIVASFPSVLPFTRPNVA